MYNFFRPLKGMSPGIMSSDKTVNSFPHFFRGGKACALHCIACQKGKPYLRLIQPARMRGRIMGMNILMSRKPHIPFRLVRTQVIQNDMDFLAWMGTHYFVHEVQKFHSSSSLVMSRHDLTGSYFHGGEKSGSTMSLIFVRKSLQCFPVWQSQISLGTLQGLDMGFLIYAQHQGISRGIKVEPYDIRCLLDKLWVSANTPTPSPRKLNVVNTQYLPHEIGRKRQRLGQKSPIPLSIPRWGWLVQHAQHTLFVLRRISVPRPGQGASLSPSSPSWAKRIRHLVMVAGRVSSSSAMLFVPIPSPAMT